MATAFGVGNGCDFSGRKWDDVEVVLTKAISNVVGEQFVVNVKLALKGSVPSILFQLEFILIVRFNF